MTHIKPFPFAGTSLIILHLALSFAAGQTASGGASGPIWVKPIKENVVVRVWSATKPEPEPVGILTKDAVVEVVGEATGWYKVRFTRQDAEFVGWVLKEEVVVEGTPANPPIRTPKPPEPTPTPPEPEKKTLSIEETHEKLMALVQVPVNEAPKYTKTFKLDGMRDEIRISSGTGIALFGPFKAKMEVLESFDLDEVIEVFVEDKVRELKKLLEEGHPDFRRVIDYYIRALEAYVEKRNPDFLRMINLAERFWKRIPGIEVGF